LIAPPPFSQLTAAMGESSSSRVGGSLYSPAASSDVSSRLGGLFSPGLLGPGLPPWSDSGGGGSMSGDERGGGGGRAPDIWSPFSEPAAASYAAALSGLAQRSGSSSSDIISGGGGSPLLFPGLGVPPHLPLSLMAAEQHNQYLWSMYLESCGASGNNSASTTTNGTPKLL
jgi:hypothetical protein